MMVILFVFGGLCMVCSGVGLQITEERHQTQEWAALNASTLNAQIQDERASSALIDLKVPKHSAKLTVLIGMMVTDREPLKKIEAYRQSLRNFTANGTSNCDIKLFFFFGQSPSKAVIHGPDIVRGNFPENMNTGKTREWIRWAVSWFEQNRRYVNSHSVIIKMDSDAAVRWEELDRLLPQFMAPTYFGKLQGRGMCNMDQWTKCLTGNLPREKCICIECILIEGFHGKCWQYMAGGFYGVTLSVAEKLTQCWHHDYIGIEDALFGLTIKRCQIQVKVHNIDGTVFLHSPLLKNRTVEELDLWSLVPAQSPPGRRQRARRQKRRRQPRREGAT